MSARARACARERRRNPSAGPLDVIHRVCMSTCECMYMYVCACRPHASVCPCACVCARDGSGGATRGCDL